MKKKKTGLAIFFIIWGMPVTLFGALLVILTLSMILEGEDLLSSGILTVILLALTFALGILPLIKGIRILQGKEKKREKVETQQVQTVSEQIIQPAQNVQSMQPIVSQESVIHETPLEKFVADQAGKQILCKDEQFDDGDWPMIKALLKIVLYIVPPIVAMCVGYVLVTQSAGGRIQPNTWQAWVSMLVVVGGCLLMVMSMVVWAKYNAIGNKFYYFIVHEDEGVSVAYLDTGRLGSYVANKASASEKIKAAPSLLYVLLFFFCSKNRRTAVRLARMQMYFQINQKYRFVEKLLMSDSYDQYSDKIIAVQKIKYFSKGCEVSYTVMVDGVQQERKQYIYRETSHYELLIGKLKQMCANHNRVGDELSDVQAIRVRKNIYRRLAVLAVLALVCAAVVYMGITQYYESSYKAELLQQSGEEILGYARDVLAYRGRRRAYRGVVFIVFVMGAALIKLLTDAIRVHTFTCIPVEVLEYREKTGVSLKKLLGDYQYFATVRYNGMTVTVGMSKEVWEQKERVTPLLVLRKNVPYCVIF